jgi:DNA polymerase V
MKVKKVVEIKTHYSFEAPVLSAGKYGRSIKLEEFHESLDLNSYLVPDPQNIFLVRVCGESMIDKQIYDGDILVINRKEQPAQGKIVIASLNGEMAVKIFSIRDGKVYLVSANKKFLPIEIEGFMEFQIQGVVKHVIHSI